MPDATITSEGAISAAMMHNILFFIFLFLAAIAIGMLFMWFIRRKDVPDNILLIIAKDFIELAKMNCPPHIKELYMMSAPNMFYFKERFAALIGSIHTRLEYAEKKKETPDETKKQMKATLCKMEEETKAIKEEILSEYVYKLGKSGNYIGKIIGLNCINLYVDPQELGYQMDENGNFFTKPDGKTKIIITPQEVEDSKKILGDCENRIWVIVYNPSRPSKPPGIRDKIPLLGGNKEEHAIMAFEDELVGVGDSDAMNGRITAIGNGMERHGFYFSVLSGHPERTRIVLEQMNRLAIMRTLTLFQSNIFTIVNGAIKINPELTQALAIKNAERPITQPRPESQKGG